MDVQLKRGILEVSVLSTLCKADSYGYQIVKDLSFVVDITESTLYPILKRLEAGNYIVVYTIEHDGRLRKYYRITRAGRDKINSFLYEWKDVMKIYNYIDANER